MTRESPVAVLSELSREACGVFSGRSAVAPARSTLEVETRRLLLAHGFTDFVREFPLEWNGRTYRFDFAFEDSRTILETNGRRWHDDPLDYEDDNEKWSVPGRLGWADRVRQWEKVTKRPRESTVELRATMTAESAFSGR